MFKKGLQAIRARQPIQDAKLAALAAIAIEMAAKHAQPDLSGVKAFLDAGYQERDLLYSVFAAAVKMLFNHSNQALRTTVDEKFAPYKVD